MRYQAVYGRNEMRIMARSAWKAFIRSLIIILSMILFMIAAGICVFSVLSALALTKGPM
jgi:hypothetical protein